MATAQLSSSWTAVSPTPCTISHLAGDTACLFVGNALPARDLVGVQIGPSQLKLSEIFSTGGATVYARAKTQFSTISITGVASESEAGSLSGNPKDWSGTPPELVPELLLREIEPMARLGFYVQNQSGLPIQVVFDDGANKASTIIILGPADNLGSRGGAVDSTQLGAHQGRIRVFGAPASQFALRTW